jgi:hypothetical protein
MKYTADLAIGTMKKAKILEDRATFQSYVMLEKLITTPKACEYLLLQRHEELKRL